MNLNYLNLPIGLVVFIHTLWTQIYQGWYKQCLGLSIRSHGTLFSRRSISFNGKQNGYKIMSHPSHQKGSKREMGGGRGAL